MQKINKMEALEALTNEQRHEALALVGKKMNKRSKIEELNEELMGIEGVPVVVTAEMLAENPELDVKEGEVILISEDTLVESTDEDEEEETTEPGESEEESEEEEGSEPEEGEGEDETEEDAEGEEENEDDVEEDLGDKSTGEVAIEEPELQRPAWVDPVLWETLSEEQKEKLVKGEKFR